MSNGTVTDFKIGGVLARSLAVLVGNIVPFGLLSMALMSPPYIIVLTFGTDFAAAGSAAQPNVAVAIAAIVGIVILLYFVLSAALIYGTIRELRGDRAGLGEIVGWGLSLLFPVVSVAVVTSLGVLLGPSLIVAIGMSAIPNPWIVLPPALAVGLILFTRWWVAIAVVVVERPGAVKALRRSAELTLGHRWPVFAILMVVVIGQNILDRAAHAVLSGLPSVLIVTSFLITAAATAYTAVVGAVCYHDLRVLKDGGDINDIAQVFD